ncbi:MAG: FMN-binding negative transcriptional regulator [Deltaproteobacteria bacterium]
MYIPAAFREDDAEKLFDLIEQHGFGLLISDFDGTPFATHLPLLLDRAVAPHGCLIGHMARANPHWEKADGKTVLAVFAGPHAYVSPTWYEAENVVPTWNYVAVHAYGTFRAIHEREALLKIVGQCVHFYEAALPSPWTFDGRNEYAQRMAGAIVGFRIEISRLEGKWKLNQNHPRERREKVIRALRASGDETSRAVADLMQHQLAEEAGRPS